MDITSQVIQAINGWLQSLGQSVLGPALTAAGQLIFQTPAFDGLAPVKQSWRRSCLATAVPTAAHSPYSVLR